MVRLKGFGRSWSAWSALPFQFHYGSIKGAILFYVDLRIIYFNSTMVRLKALLLFYIRLFLMIFQFHYGSIKGVVSVCCLLFLFVFQFHYGSIKGVGRLPYKQRYYIISIPLWFD